jgi:glutathione S-transferase
VSPSNESWITKSSLLNNHYRYLLETYGTDSFLLPPTSQPAARAKVREWMSAAEGTFMIHALAILYARWRLPEAAKSSLPEMEKGLSVNVQRDLDWLEDELKSGNGEFLVGDELTVADIMVHFSISFIFARKLGTEGKSWPAVERWMEELEGLEGYQKVVKKTGYKL